MGTWTYTSSNNLWSLSGGTVRSVVIAAENFSAESAFRIDLSNRDHNVKAIILSSRDGRSCFEAGIEGANAVIRRVDFGAVTGLSSAAHGVAAGRPLYFEVRYVEGVIEVRVNGATTPTVTHDNSGDQRYASHRHFGFVSTVDGARVTNARLYPLVPQFVDYAEVLFVVCYGYVWYTEDGVRWSYIRGRQFNPTGRVALAEFRGTCYGLDGNNPRRISATTFQATEWAVPDQIKRCTGLEPYQDRLAAFGDRDDDQNLYLCATGDPDDWDFTLYPDELGAAFVLGATNRPKVPQPIKAVLQARSGVLLIGCTGSLWRLVGDPVFGIPALEAVTGGTGCSGPDSMVLGDEGLALVHSPEGFYAVVENAARNLNAGVLTEGIQIPREEIDDYHVIVQRAVRRHRCHIWLTPKVSGPALHFSYNERVARFDPDGGGFEPETMPDAMGPTAAGTWRGNVIFGGRDSYINQFDPDAKSDAGTAIDCRFPVSLLDTFAEDTDAVLHQLQVTPGRTSDDITVKVYGGATPERAYQRESSELRYTATASQPFGIFIQGARAPALVAELSNGASALRRIEVDSISAWITEEGMTPAPRLAAVAPPAAPAPPSFEAPPVTPGPGGGPGNDEGEGWGPSVDFPEEFVDAGFVADSLTLASAGGGSSGSSVIDGGP